jgi:hypothetical protein
VIRIADVCAAVSDSNHTNDEIFKKAQPCEGWAKQGTTLFSRFERTVSLRSVNRKASVCAHDRRRAENGAVLLPQEGKPAPFLTGNWIDLSSPVEAPLLTHSTTDIDGVAPGL